MRDRTLIERDLADFGPLREHLDQAKAALVNTGYFGAAQVGYDIAPRIVEFANVARERLDRATAERDAYRNDRDWYEQELRERTKALRAAEADLSAARESLDQQTAEIELLRARYEHAVSESWHWHDKHSRLRAGLRAAKAKADADQRVIAWVLKLASDCRISPTDRLASIRDRTRRALDGVA